MPIPEPRMREGATQPGWFFASEQLPAQIHQIKTDKCERKAAVKYAVVAMEYDSSINFVRHPLSTLLAQPCSLRLHVTLTMGGESAGR
jgi:hypothetical protein